MARDLDKYPADSDRRRFVKGVVGGASLLGLGTATAASVDTLTSSSGAGGGATVYFGMENTAGPAPRAMPQIPVEIDDDGFLKGVWPANYDEEEDVATQEIAGETYSSAWFQYCGVQTSPAIQPDSDRDNFFRYTGGNKYSWQAEQTSQGDKVHVDDFADYEDWGNGIGSGSIGKPAALNWRSQDLEPANTLAVQVIRSPIVEEKAQESDWLAATTERGFVANLNKCTHFCCVPGFKHTEQAAEYDADQIYCQCHQSLYDPYNIVKRSFTALPRPE
jgi:Rieske Fe-S protein